MRDILGYQGKVCVITGAFSGMGEAAASVLCDLGAEVHALDIKDVKVPVEQFVRTDLSDPASIDAAIDRLPAKIDCLFNCAGVPGPPFSALDTMLVNFVGLKHLTESLIPRIVEGGAIASITSVAGMGFQKNLDNVKALIEQPDFAAGRAWCAANPDVANGYIFSKQCITAYTMMRAEELSKRQIRINCLSPSPTDTPMLPDFHSQVSKDFIEEHFLPAIGRNATAAEMGEPLVFLNSNAARFISGHNLFVDYGYTGAVAVGQRTALGIG